MFHSRFINILFSLQKMKRAEKKPNSEFSFPEILSLSMTRPEIRKRVPSDNFGGIQRLWEHRSECISHISKLNYFFIFVFQSYIVLKISTRRKVLSPNKKWEVESVWEVTKTAKLAKQYGGDFSDEFLRKITSSSQIGQPEPKTKSSLQSKQLQHVKSSGYGKKNWFEKQRTFFIFLFYGMIKLL